MGAIEPCHGHRLTGPEVLRLGATLDPATSRINPETLEILDQEFAAFRQGFMRPVMGTDD